MKRLMMWICVLLISACSEKKESIVLSHNTNEDFEIVAYAQRSLFDVDIWLVLRKNGEKKWGPIRIDSRDAMEDAHLYYKDVTWSNDDIKIVPGHDHPIKVSLADGAIK